MRNILYILIIIITTNACQNRPTQAPETLEEFQAALAEKKNELNTLEDEIKLLTDKVAELDPSLKEKSKLVDTSIMQVTDFTRYINIQGSVVADDPVNAVSVIAGRIEKLYVKEGDVVRQGRIVAKIDLEAVQKQIDEITTALDLANDIHERQKRLWDQEIGSEIQYLQAKNAVERLEKSLETLRHQQTKATVYAPISGTVDMVMTNQGEVASPGTPIIQLLNTSKLKIVTDLPENYLKIVRKGQRVQLSFPNLGIETTGRVSLLGRRIDPTNRTLKVEIKPSKTSRLLKPNLLTEIKILELTSENVIMIPLEYILQEVNGTEFIYVASKDEKGIYRAKKKYILLGETSEGSVIVREGLVVGESVIYKGSRNVSDGELVEFVN